MFLDGINGVGIVFPRLSFSHSPVLPPCLNPSNFPLSLSPLSATVVLLTLLCHCILIPLSYLCAPHSLLPYFFSLFSHFCFSSYFSLSFNDSLSSIAERGSSVGWGMEEGRKL